MATPKITQTPMYEIGQTPMAGGKSSRTPNYEAGFTPATPTHGGVQNSPFY